MAWIRKMLIRFVVLLILAGLAFYFLVPEKHVKSASRYSVRYVAEELEVNPGMANFLVNTKFGRKISYAFFKKKIERIDFTELYETREHNATER